jgi:hypothetical protein
MRHATAFGDSAKTVRTIEEAPKALPDDHDAGPASESPLFPLMPSVQILFAACLLLSIDRSGSQPRRSNPRPIGRQTELAGAFGRQTGMGRRIRLHHLGLDDDWRDAKGPTG